ncbi:hypothetical protein KUV89_02105 [Marinobacter hydrocarbonoclasticus]|nr:hypothetical protein [Marinobacter nauticus]
MTTAAEAPIDEQQVYQAALGWPDPQSILHSAMHIDARPCCLAANLSPLAKQLRLDLAERGDNPKTLALLGQLELEQHLTQLARHRFNRALEMDAHQLEALTGLAQLALAEGAQQEYQRYRFLVERHPSLTWFHLAFLAKAQLRHGEVDAAERLIELAARKQGQTVQGHSNTLPLNARP